MNHRSQPRFAHFRRSDSRIASSVAAGVRPNFAPVELSDWRRWWKQRGENELRAVLLREWDPVGVKDEPLAAYEYDSYALPLAQKLQEGASAADVAGLLDAAEAQLGLGAAARNAVTAERILQWYTDSTRSFDSPS